MFYVSKQLCVFIIATLACASLAVAQEKTRTWTSADGKHKQEARLVKADGDTITLENEAGKKIKLSLAKLSQTDRDYVKKFVASSSKKFTKGRLTKIERRSIFARDIYNAYQSELEIALPVNKELLTAKVAEFKKLAEVSAISFGDRFVPEAEVAGLRTEAEKIVKEWFDDATGMNSRVRLSALEQVKKIDPISTDAAIFLGLHYMFYERDYDTAARHFKDAIKRGTRYSAINGLPEKRNLISALNNLAVLEVRANNPARACDHWDAAADVDEALNREVTRNIAKTGRFLDANGGLGVSGSKAVSKRFSKLVGRTNTRNYDRNGWLYLLPVSQEGVPYQRSDFLVGFDGIGVRVHRGYLEDIVCLNCEGKGTLKCHNSSCKSGYVTTIIPGKLVWKGKDFVKVPTTTRTDPCPVCRTKQIVACWSCKSSGTQARK